MDATGTMGLSLQESRPVNIDNTNTNPKDVIKERGWAYALLLLANQGLATLAFCGIGVNLVLLLTRVLQQDNASAANNFSKWTGTVYLCSLIGAFLSDSYWGRRYLTCAIFQVIFVVGLVLISLSSSWLFLVKPGGCGDGKEICVPTTTYGSVLFYMAIYLVAFGYGGHLPTIVTFGSDQFDDNNPKQRSAKGAFFCYFYFALNTGSLFSNTILVYFEDNGKWTLGFWVSTASAVLALVGFLLGTPGYRFLKPCGNPIPHVMQVFVAAFKKCKVKLGEGVTLYEVEGTELAIKGSQKIVHVDEYLCLDKAAVITDENRQGLPDPRRLCTVTQIEEAKCIIRTLPICLCTKIYSVTQMASPFLYDDMLMEIFLRLPAKSAGKFRLLSKTWHTNLSTSQFINLHLNIRKSKQANLILKQYYQPLYILKLPIKVLNKVEFPINQYGLVDSCNGLVLLARPKHDMVLVNPITLQHVQVPMSSILISERIKFYRCGFGYDSCSDDYKIVIHWSDIHTIVYSLKSNVWKTVNNFPQHPITSCKGVCTNGALHWVSRRYKCPPRIVGFSLTDEVFYDIPAPVSARDWKFPFYTVYVLEGCLCVMDESGSVKTDLWIMKEYGVEASWTKFTVVRSGIYWPHSRYRPLFFTGNEEIISLFYDHEMQSYNLEDGAGKIFVVDGWGSEKRCDYFDGCAFFDSLVSPIQHV